MQFVEGETDMYASRIKKVNFFFTSHTQLFDRANIMMLSKISGSLCNAAWFVEGSELCTEMYFLLGICRRLHHLSSYKEMITTKGKFSHGFL